jgi:hypothetical protein
MSKRNRKERCACVTPKETLWQKWEKVIGTWPVSAEDMRQARTWFELLFASGRAGLPIVCFGKESQLSGYERAAFELGQVYGSERRRAWCRVKSRPMDHVISNGQTGRPCP